MSARRQLNHEGWQLSRPASALLEALIYYRNKVVPVPEVCSSEAGRYLVDKCRGAVALLLAQPHMAASSAELELEDLAVAAAIAGLPAYHVC
jgi:hypothetical protein